MEETLGKVAPNESLCPSLSLKERMIGFIATICAGYIISILAYIALFVINDMPLFIVFYTIGNICILTASCFLWGPAKQFKTMMKPTRMAISIVLILLIIATLVVGIMWSEYEIIILILAGLQFLAMAWYNLSYIPFGRKIVKKIFKKCCDCDEEDGYTAADSA